MSRRPLVFLSALTFVDYLLWNWSLNASHDVLALVSGLTLPPLALACLWLGALSAARVIARTARRHGRDSAGAPASRERDPGSPAVPPEAAATSAASTGASSGKLAA